MIADKNGITQNLGKHQNKINEYWSTEVPMPAQSSLKLAFPFGHEIVSP